MLGYNAFALLALAVGLGLFARECRRRAIPARHALLAGTAVFVASRVGALLLFSLETGWTRDVPLAWAGFSTGGLSLFGGLGAALLVLVAYARLAGLRLLPFLDALAPATALAFAVGRLGCLVAGCCRGAAMEAPIPGLGWVRAPHLFPAPLLHAAVEAAIGLLLLRPRTAAWSPGVRTGRFLVAYGLSRAAIELVRTEPRILAGMSMAQLLAIPTVALGVALVLASPRSGDGRRQGEPGVRPRPVWAPWRGHVEAAASRASSR